MGKKLQPAATKSECDRCQVVTRFIKLWEKRSRENDLLLGIWTRARLLLLHAQKTGQLPKTPTCGRYADALMQAVPNSCDSGGAHEIAVRKVAIEIHQCEKRARR